MQNAKQEADEGNEQTAYYNAMENYYRLMQATSLAEAHLYKELYGKTQIEELANGHNINYFDQITPDSTDPFEETLYSVKRANDKAYYKHYMKDGQGGDWDWDDSDLQDDNDIACASIVAPDRGDDSDEMAEVCDAYHDGGYCLFYITNRNCVQDAIYLITNDKHREGEWGFTEDGKSNRQKNDWTQDELEEYIDYETGCFFVPYPDRNNFSHVIHKYGDIDTDHEMEDDCGYWDVLQSWSRKNNTGDYNSILNESDEVWGHMVGYIGELVKHPAPYVTYTEGVEEEEEETFEIKDSQDPSKNTTKFKKTLLKRQGGLVNPIFPKCHIKIG